MGKNDDMNEGCSECGRKAGKGHEDWCTTPPFRF
jgi:hypothetical protein